LEPTATGALLTYSPSKSDETFSLDLPAASLTAAKTLARKADPSGLRDLLLVPDQRDRALKGAGTSALVAPNTWRWALPLFGGPEPAGHKR
jgi:hypothetical protein